MNDVIYEYGCEVTSTKECPLNEEIRADERAKVLDEFEQFYISYDERKCENCDDDSEYACFKCMMKKFKEQKEDNTRPFYANEWNS